MEVPVISLVSSSEEEAATSVRKRKQEEEYRLISDLAGFDILRDVIEAEALLRAKRRERKKPKKKQAVSLHERRSIYVPVYFYHFLCLNCRSCKLVDNHPFCSVRNPFVTKCTLTSRKL